MNPLPAHDLPGLATAAEPSHRAALGQYFTPRWAAEAIVERHFSDLPRGSVVVEPSCGDGVFLHAIPEHVHAIGVEIDPHWARVARERTGRTVLLGDFLTAPLPAEVHALVGNPPFQADTVAAFLERAHGLLVEGGKCGLILPTYIFQTSSKVMAMNSKWTIDQQLMPRNLFPGLSLPLSFGLFTKEHHRRLFGFFLYEETAEVAKLGRDARHVLERSAASGSVWRQAVHQAFDRIGESTARLPDLYAALEGSRPTENPRFREQIRKVLQTRPEFIPVERGVWQRIPLH